MNFGCERVEQNYGFMRNKNGWNFKFTMLVYIVIESDQKTNRYVTSNDKIMKKKRKEKKNE